MRGLRYSNVFRGRGWVLLFCLPWIMLGCGNLDRSFGAGGAADSGSLFNVESVSPIYFEENTNQVDILQDNCADPGDLPEPEPYTDHYAEIVFSNRHEPNAQVETASWIYLSSYEIHYAAITQGTDIFLSSNVIPITQIYGIPPCDLGAGCGGTPPLLVELVPVREKTKLYDQLQNNPSLQQLHYNVHYVFYGENDFGEEVSADGYANFYATDYDNCGGG